MLVGRKSNINPVCKKLLPQKNRLPDTIGKVAYGQKIQTKTDGLVLQIRRHLLCALALILVSKV